MKKQIILILVVLSVILVSDGGLLDGEPIELVKQPIKDIIFDDSARLTSYNPTSFVITKEEVQINISSSLNHTFVTDLSLSKSKESIEGIEWGYFDVQKQEQEIVKFNKEIFLAKLYQENDTFCVVEPRNIKYVNTIPISVDYMCINYKLMNKDQKLSLVDKYSGILKFNTDIDPEIIIVTTNLSIWYPFNESSGSVASDWADINSSLLVNTNSKWDTLNGYSAINTSITASCCDELRIDPASGANLGSGNGFTISAEIRFENSSHNQMIIDWSSGYEFKFQIDTNNKIELAGICDRTAIFNYQFYPNTNYHVVATFNASGDTGDLYVNGVWVEKNTALNSDCGMDSPALKVGHRDFDAGNTFNGTIRQLRYWGGYVLTSVEALDVCKSDDSIICPSSTPDSCTQLSAPTLSQFNITNSSIGVTYTPISYVEKYILFKNNVNTANSTNLDYNFETLTNNTEYDLQVAAFNSSCLTNTTGIRSSVLTNTTLNNTWCVQNLVYTSWADATTCNVSDRYVENRTLWDSNVCGVIANTTETRELVCCYRPSAPLFSSAITVTNSSMNINWSQITYIQKYILYRDNVNIYNISPYTNTSYNNTGLTNNTQYYYNITSYNESCLYPESLSSNQINSTTYNNTWVISSTSGGDTGGGSSGGTGAIQKTLYPCKFTVSPKVIVLTTNKTDSIKVCNNNERDMIFNFTMKDDLKQYCFINTTKIVINKNTCQDMIYGCDFTTTKVNSLLYVSNIKFEDEYTVIDSCEQYVSFNIGELSLWEQYKIYTGDKYIFYLVVVGLTIIIASILLFFGLGVK